MLNILSIHYSVFRKLLFLIIFISSSATVIFAEKYVTKDFSFEIPIGWERIPNKVVDEYLDSLGTLGLPVDKAIYDTGFQLKNAEFDFDFPYFFIKHYESKKYSDSEIVKFANGLTDAASKLPTYKEFNGFIKDIVVGTPNIDLTKKQIILASNPSLSDIGDFEGYQASMLNVFQFYDSGYLFFYFYSYPTDFETDLILFNNIIASTDFSNAKIGSGNIDLNFFSLIIPFILLLTFILFIKSISTFFIPHNKIERFKSIDQESVSMVRLSGWVFFGFGIYSLLVRLLFQSQLPEIDNSIDAIIQIIVIITLGFNTTRLSFLSLLVCTIIYLADVVLLLSANRIFGIGFLIHLFVVVSTIRGFIGSVKLLKQRDKIKSSESKHITPNQPDVKSE